jgi:hypothetical protein
MRHAGGLEPVFLEPNPAEQTRIELVSSLQSAGLELVRDVRDAFGAHIESFSVDPSVALRPLDAFFSNPDAKDARLFQGILFENAFGATALHALIPQSDELDSRTCLWEEGRQAILRPKRSRGRAPLDALANLAVRWLVDGLIVQALPRAKAIKLKNDPARFFSDSRNRYVQMIGRRYLFRRQ